MAQETLKEAAQKIYPIEYIGRMFMLNRDELNNSYKQEAFIEGAKWQEKRMYSEEEVLKIIMSHTDFLCNEREVLPLTEWFKRFKKH